MKPHEEALLLSERETLKFKALYFQALDEVRKANKGLNRLARNNQFLRDANVTLLARLAKHEGAAINEAMTNHFKVWNNGNGAAAH